MYGFSEVLNARRVPAETIAALPQVVELNIGHFLIGEAVFEGLAETVKFMRAAMDRGRKKARHP